MSQYRARKKALNQKRDQMMDLFVDSRIKLANKPTTYGEFYDYVTDLDRPAPKAKRLSAKATPQAKPVVATQAVQQSKPVPKTTQTATATTQASTKKEAATQQNKDGNSFWDSYTK